MGMEKKWRMAIGNTLFKKKDIHNYKYMRHDDGTVVDKAMICYVVVSRNVIG